MHNTLKNNVAIVFLGKARAIDDLALPLYFTLKKLKYNVKIVRGVCVPDATNILMNLCDYPDLDISNFPKDTIIYNLEQLVEGSKGVSQGYLHACSNFSVWDYSEVNIKRFKDIYNIDNIYYVPFGYCPEMTRISTTYPKDIDVLLYGALNERRTDMVEALRRLSVNAIAVTGAYGIDRDILIARSKLIMNIHFYIPGIQEIIRLGYLWANKKCVVCEQNTDTSIHFGYENSCIYASYEDIPRKIITLLKNPEAIKAMGNAAFLQFSNHTYLDIIGNFLGRDTKLSAYNNKKQDIPSLCNVGSGKNFLVDALNIDISHRWNPDVVLDISQPIRWGESTKTKRYGIIVFKKCMFKKIRLFDVLEHVSDIITTMTNLIDLLCDGGELHINVSYDLSVSAWQDPTHIHAFNENSWLYYTEWFWYIGWREVRFELLNIDYTLSNFGKKLKQQGERLEDILHIPRAVDFMEVHLKKRFTNFEEKIIYDKQTRAIYDEPQSDWSSSVYETNISSI